MRRDWLMPKLGLTMTEGVLAEWTVAAGKGFKAGDCVFVVENDKAATEIAAERDGMMGEPVVGVGETVVVGAVLGHWDDGLHLDAPGLIHQVDPLRPADASRRPVTPLARRLARQHGIGLAAVSGSGPRGRVRARDVEAVMQQQGPETGVSTAAQALPMDTANAPLAGRLRAPTSPQQSMARRLTAAKQEIPHFYLAREVEVSRLLQLHRQLKDPQADPRLTLNHFFVAAAGRALRALPDLNRIWTEQGVLTLERTDVGVAVHTDRGLLVPVVRDVARLGLVGLARQVNGLAQRARDGRLGPDEMRGGAITVSNAGMHNLSAMTSIIVPGQAMILGVGSVRELFRPDERGQPELRREINLVLSVDHRVLDGVSGAALLNAIVEGLAHPTRLLFE